MTLSEFTELLNSKQPMSDRFKFDPLSLDDLDGMSQYAYSNTFYEHFETAPLKSISELEDYILKLIDRQLKINGYQTAVYWAVREKKSQDFIGTFGLLNIDYRRRSCEWGFGINPIWRKDGHIFELIPAVLEYVFDELKFNRVYSITSSENLAVINLLNAFKFHEEGTLRKYYKHEDGYYFDGKMFSIIAEEFNQKYDLRSDDVRATEEVLNEVISLIQEIFPHSKITNDSSVENVVGWDSLSHVDVILSIESSFDIKFASKDIRKAYSVESIVKLIEIYNEL